MFMGMTREEMLNAFPSPRGTAAESVAKVTEQVGREPSVALTIARQIVKCRHGRARPVHILVGYSELRRTL